MSDTHRITDRLARTITVTVGPFAIYFGNVNTAMGLRGHYHTGAVTLEYAAPDGHGYPSFKVTNDALRAELQRLTAGIFRDATNETVAWQLFDALDGWVAPEWEPWGGNYHLTALHLDVQGVLDKIGHDEGTTRYTVRKEGSS
jgi:hypothetical protein